MNDADRANLFPNPIVVAVFDFILSISVVYIAIPNNGPTPCCRCKHRIYRTKQAGRTSNLRYRVGRRMPVNSSVELLNIEASMFFQKWLLRIIVMGWAASFAGAAAAADIVVRQFSAGGTSTTVGIAAGEDVEVTARQPLLSDAAGGILFIAHIVHRILR